MRGPSVTAPKRWRRILQTRRSVSSAPPGTRFSNSVNRQASDTVQQLSKQADDIAGQARDFAGEAYRRGGQAADYVGGRVEQQPLASILLAFWIGYAISYLVHSRWSA